MISPALNFQQVSMDAAGNSAAQADRSGRRSSLCGKRRSESVSQGDHLARSAGGANHLFGLERGKQS
jgi:hypothetical protein